ncbi:DNA methyltransferase [Chryseobacterium salviniae]|uniref:DNA methyltransferase n=1 Tax=Chryseobacterium salviniae TaxID=3101750 RepID=A0ABU6HX89_9FLAO|nr:DNA methyltransferase [Chryseobacterium sp. T9W2-O]MEC3877685.1 DNA methyltransferase [Chryseobacterium sp. T9W2-O]
MKNLKDSAKAVLSQTRKIEIIPTHLLEIPEEYLQLFGEISESEFIDQLSEQIQKNGFYTPITTFKCDDKYVILDGVSRLRALQGLGVNDINCFVTELDPQSSDEVKDLIIEFKMNADFSLNQIQNMIFHFLRMGSQYSELDNSTMNQKVQKLAEILGPGWGRSNIFHFLNVYKWEKLNPTSHLNLIKKIFDGELTVGKAKDAIEFFNDEFLPYTLENELESGIVEEFIKGNIRFKKDVKKLIEAYFHKTTERFTPINTPDEISSDNYQIIHCDSRKVEFKDGTKIQGIFTSPPYYQQIRYSKPNDPEYNNELGWEKTPEEYVKNVISVIKRGADVMDEKGVIMININETFQKGVCVGIIPLLITEMKKDFHYIQTCMWVKPDAKPQQNKVKRLMNSFEYILIFSKSKKYNYNQFKLYNSDKAASVSKGCSEQSGNGKKVSGLHISNTFDQCRDFMFEEDFTDYLVLNHGSGRSQDENLSQDFFGSFPTLLPIPFVMSFVPENGTVYDPFGGTGTTGRTLLSLNRKVIITELLGKNIPNIKMMLEKGESDFDLSTYTQMKEDYNYQEGTVDLAA